MLIDKNKLTPGDIILLDGRAWISRQIKKFMSLYRRTLNLPQKTTYSHSATVIKVWDQIYVGESQAKGYVVRPIPYIYLLPERVKILTPKKAYTVAQQNKISKLATKLSFEQTRYDYAGLFSQAVYIITGKWIGKKGVKASKRLYCTEASAKLANSIRKDTFKDVYSVNPLDIEINKNYKVKYD